VLPASLVDDIVTLLFKLLGNKAKPASLLFLKEHFLPTYRNATAPLLAKLSPLKKLEIAKVMVGAWTKFAYYTIWQEEIVKWKGLFEPHMNQVGAKLMPQINALADMLTGFKDGDASVKECEPDVYPGAGWCRLNIPHPKSHEISANAFFDLVSLGEYLAGLYKSMDTYETLGEELDPHQWDISSDTMVLETVVNGIQVLVRTVTAAHDTNFEQEADISSNFLALKFWQSVAAGATALATALLVVAMLLLHKVRTLLQQGNPDGPSHTYMKLAGP